MFYSRAVFVVKWSPILPFNPMIHVWIPQVSKVFIYKNGVKRTQTRQGLAHFLICFAVLISGHNKVPEDANKSIQEKEADTQKSLNIDTLFLELSWKMTFGISNFLLWQFFLSLSRSLFRNLFFQFSLLFLSFAEAGVVVVVVKLNITKKKFLAHTRIAQN